MIILNVKANKEQVRLLREKWGTIVIDERYSPADVDLKVNEDIVDDVTDYLDEQHIEYDFTGRSAD